jgi:hypothetical protein
MAEARRLSHIHTLADARAWAFWVGWCVRSDPKSILERGDEMLALAVEHDFEIYRAGVLSYAAGLWRHWGTQTRGFHFSLPA